MSPRNITGVNGLEATRLVTRSPHPSDGRAVLVTLTEDGSRAAAALARGERRLARYLFAGFTAPELSNLASGLERLLGRLTEPGFASLRRTALRRWPLKPS